jgi:PPK2 family polyphosphate:nucleotide phosphotransferase
MDNRAKFKFLESLRVKPGKKVNLKKFHTDFDQKTMTKDEGEVLLQQGVKLLSDMQDKLYAHNQYSILIIFQAMDAAGKDSAIKHIMSGLNPQGVKVTSYKAPSTTELDHHYLWRHYTQIPARGEIGIFNRSHYENVLVTRVHPEFILKENNPHIVSVKDISGKFWLRRFEQINRFERNLVENGTIVLKFFLHVSKEEQRRRLLARIDDPEKNWKFEVNDLKERGYWDQYMKAYEDMLEHCSPEHAPWFVIPADDKWFARLCIADVICKEFDKLRFDYPKVDAAGRKALEQARKMLEAEAPVKKAARITNEASPKTSTAAKKTKAAAKKSRAKK